MGAEEAPGDVADVAGPQGFDETQEDAADHGPGQVADAAQHRGGEGLETENEAHVVVGDGVVGTDHEPGHGGQGRADDEGEGDDVVHIHPHQLGDGRILGGGAHGAAQAGAVDEQQQAGHHAGGHQDDDHLQVGEGGAQHFVGLGRQHGGEGMVAAAPDHHGQVLQHDGDADGGDQGGQPGRLAQGPVGDLFDAVADGHAHRGGGHEADQGDDRARQAGAGQQLDHGKGGEGTDHDHFAMGEVDEAQDAVHHGVAEGHQGVDAAEHQAVDDLLQKNVHGIPVRTCKRRHRAPFAMGRLARSGLLLLASRSGRSGGGSRGGRCSRCRRRLGSAAQGFHVLDLAALVLVEGNGAVLQVAELVEADLGGDALEAGLADLRQVLGRLHGIGPLHGIHQDHGGVVDIGRVELDFGLELADELVLEDGAAGHLVQGHAGQGAVLAFGGGAGQGDEVGRAAAVAGEELGLQPQFLHLLGHGAALGIHAAVEDQVRLLRLDLGQDGLEVGGLVIGVLAGHHLEAGSFGGLLELVGQALAVSGTVVDDGNALGRQGLGGELGQGLALLLVVGHDAEGGGKALLGVGGVGGGAGNLGNAGIEINLGGRDGGAGVEVADDAVNLGVDELLGHGGALLGVGLVVVGNEFELDLGTADLQALGV